MQLLTIPAAGFSAAVDAFALDGEQLWFLSLLGHQQSVRALWARLVKGETAYLSEDEVTAGSPCWLAREAYLASHDVVIGRIDDPRSHSDLSPRAKKAA